MIYLKREQEAFEQTQTEFKVAYAALLDRARKVYGEKSKVRDDTPIHHRRSPADMVAMASAKCRRGDSIISSEGWEQNPEALRQVIEETLDGANYLLFLAALAKMLGEEMIK